MYAPSVTAVVVFIVILLFEHTKFEKTTWLRKKITKFGILTYCVYIIHEPITIGLKVNYPHISSLFQSLYISLFTSIVIYALASFVYKYIEKPFDQKKLIVKKSKG